MPRYIPPFSALGNIILDKCKNVAASTIDDDTAALFARALNTAFVVYALSPKKCSVCFGDYLGSDGAIHYYAHTPDCIRNPKRQVKP